jgi:hypothetical protein
MVGQGTILKKILLMKRNWDSTHTKVDWWAYCRGGSKQYLIYNRQIIGGLEITAFEFKTNRQ